MSTCSHAECIFFIILDYVLIHVFPDMTFPLFPNLKYSYSIFTFILLMAILFGQFCGFLDLCVVRLEMAA